MAYLCKQAVAVSDILLLQQLSFPGWCFAAASSLRGQLHSDLPVSLNASWQSFFVLHFQELHRELRFDRTRVRPPEIFILTLMYLQHEL